MDQHYYPCESVDTCTIKSKVGYGLVKEAREIIETNRFGGPEEYDLATKKYWCFVSKRNKLGTESFDFEKPIDYEVRLEPGIFDRITDECRYLMENLRGLKEGDNKKLDDRYWNLLKRIANLNEYSLVRIDKIGDDL